MEHSIDYSDDFIVKNDKIWDEAIDFLKSKKDLGLMFEIVLNDGINTSNPAK